MYKIMFQNLRTNNKLYILHKDSAQLEIGEVTSVTLPTMKFQTFGTNQPPIQVVDVSVQVGENSYNFPQIPAHAEIVDYQQNGNIVISCSREAMENEVHAIKQKAENIIASVEANKKLVSSCEKMLEELNPQIVEQRKTEADNKALRDEIASMRNLMAEQKKMFESLLKSVSSETAKTKTK